MTVSPFTDPITHRQCLLVVPPGSLLFATGDEPKVGVEHPDCEHLADISVELDAFYCQECRWNGRVSGAWVVDVIEGNRGGDAA